jgi:RNA polymerase sigma-70 factor (ECF subfamily)
VSIKSEKQEASLAGSAFDDYHRSLHKFLLRRLSNSADASDAVQEVFLRLLRVERSDLVRSPQAYLYGIASHVVREFQMRTRRERVTFDSQVATQRSENPRQFAADELAENLGLERQLEAALARLSSAELRILIYDRRDGLSLEEIAQKMGLSVHTVKKYLFRALALVRTILNEHERTDR